MPFRVSSIWQKGPFIRLLIPLIAGIIIQWNLQTGEKVLWTVLALSLCIIIAFFFIPFFTRYKYSIISGLFVFLLFTSLGALLVWQKDIRHNSEWFGNKYSGKDTLVLTLLETPVEKTKSYKANASVDLILHHNSVIKTNGTIIIYFKKDSNTAKLRYGNQIVLTKTLQEIKNSGNPGGFDYKRYSLFNGITHQVYLKENEFEVLSSENRNWFLQFIIISREKVVNILRRYISEEKERGLAEALLIGYKDDLDKNLVQSYTNTGVVHIIAISGLHLGLIYWLLALLFKPLQKRKKIKWLRPVLIIIGLWLFSLLAGAQPSVIRSALMFTCIVSGEFFTRKSSIFNTLALSAFILLCYNPYWLWDVGFQLSYAAVLSIVIFMQPIYNWFYIKNKILDLIWKLNAVTIAAQILTVPVSIYHFHQFPNYFLLTNFLAVPLSSLIVLGEILLCAVSFIPIVAMFVGKILYGLIWIMNSYIERIELLPFSLWDGMQISILQAVLLMTAVAGLGYWLMERSKTGLKFGLIVLLAFAALRSAAFLKADRQQQMIIYNVPQKQAIDFIEERNYLFAGDSDLLTNDFVRNFHIKPSRVLHRIDAAPGLKSFLKTGNLVTFNGYKILLIDSVARFHPSTEKLVVDILVISKNPKLYFKQLAESFSIKQVVFDGSVSAWRLRFWKRDCDSLHIPYYDINEKGAFVMRLD